MLKKLRSRHRPRRRRGVVAVEFAFVAPMLLAIVFGMIEITRAYDAQYLLQSAAREGARFAAMDRDGLLQAGETSNSKIIADVKSFLESSGMPSEDIEVKILDHENPELPFDLDDPANDLRLFDLHVAVPYSNVSYSSVSDGNDYDMTGKITFRNGRATISQ